MPGNVREIHSVLRDARVFTPRFLDYELLNSLQSHIHLGSDSNQHYSLSFLFVH